MIMVKQPGCDVQEVTALVQKHIPDAKIENDFSLELSFILPHESKAYFSALFEEIEEKLSDLKIASYGASVTTMEEVFLKCVPKYMLMISTFNKYNKINF